MTGQNISKRGMTPSTKGGLCVCPAQHLVPRPGMVFHGGQAYSNCWIHACFSCTKYSSFHQSVQVIQVKLAAASSISDGPVQLSCRVSKRPVRSGQVNICRSLKVGKLGWVNLIKPTGLIYSTVRTRPFSDLEISQGISIWTWNVFRTHQSMTNSPSFSAR